MSNPSDDADDPACKELAAEVKKFSKRVQKYHASLNDEGIWLFLAALGCWGVDGKDWHIAFALVGTLTLFAWRLIIQRGHKNDLEQSFTEQVKSLEAKINESLPYDDCRRRLVTDLKARHKKELSGPSVFLRTWPFFVSWLFFFATAAEIWPW